MNKEIPSKRVNFRMPPQQKDRLDAYAKVKGRSQAETLRRIIDRFFAREEQRQDQTPVRFSNLQEDRMGRSQLDNSVICKVEQASKIRSSPS